MLSQLPVAMKPEWQFKETPLYKAMELNEQIQIHNLWKILCE